MFRYDAIPACSNLATSTSSRFIPLVGLVWEDRCCGSQYDSFSTRLGTLFTQGKAVKWVLLSLLRGCCNWKVWLSRLLIRWSARQGDIFSPALDYHELQVTHQHW